MDESEWGMFDKLGKLIVRHPWKVLAIWLTVGVALSLFAPEFDTRCQDDDVRFMPERCLSVRGHELLQKAFPKEVFGSKVIMAVERKEGALTAADLAVVDRLAAEVQIVRDEQPGLGIGTISTYRDPLIGAKLKSTDGQCTLLMVALQSPFLAFKTGEAVQHLERRLDAVLAAHQPVGTPPLTTAITGPSGIGRDLNDASFKSLDATTWATFVLVVVILLLVYRSPVLALIPLVTIGTSVWMSLRILAVLSLWPDFQLVNVTRIFVVVVLYGAGTDYCLFLISRYREEMQQGEQSGPALQLGLRQVGWALTASAGTVVIGLGMMGFAEFAKLRYTGPAIALSLVFALAASLTLAPALLRVAGTWAFWPRRWASLRPRLRPADPEERGRPTFWDWVSAKISARPLTIWAVTVLLLLPLAILGYRTVYVYDICAELPRDSESQKGLDIIRRHFVVGEIGPLTVLLQGKKDWAGPEGRAFIADLSARLERMPNVAEVRSLHQPLGTPIATPAANGPKYDPTTMLSKLGDSIAAKVAATRYVARLPEGNVTRVDVVFRSEPFALESCQTMTAMQRVLERFIRASKFEDAQFAFYGVTPLTSDFAMVHEGDRFRVNSLVLGGILLILLIVVRKPVVAIYLLLSVLFSYYVTIGATELMVLGWLDNHLAQVDWKVPYFLFTILVAIGEDYNIFLIARVLEERKRYGMHEGTKRALARTGATITSCGLIMAGTFATMMLCSLTTLVQLGLALAFGVLLDTFIVRPILVPTFLLMTNRDRATATPQPQTVPFPTVEPEVLRRSA